MISLPTDPEAAADALIAAFAGRSTRGKLVLPEYVPATLPDGDLDAQPCVVVEASALTYAGLPIFGAPQSLIDKFADPGVASTIGNLGKFNIAGLRFTELPWLGGQLALLPHREGQFEVPFFVSNHGITLAARTNGWIYTAMSTRPAPQLDDDLLAYVRFFFATVVGGLGAFNIIGRQEDAIWLPNAMEVVKREFVEKLSLFRLIGTTDDGRLEARGTVVFKNALFITSTLVSRDWTIELANEDLLIEDLPIAFGQGIDLLVRR